MTNRSLEATPGGKPVLTRRERQRLATYEEIVSTARELLGTGQEVSVRAVATAMGLTAPALYRYVEGHAGLLELLTRQIFTDVVDAMAAARDRYPAEDPAPRIVAAATAFRRWALTHPPEFRMVFASPPGSSTDVRTPGSTKLPGMAGGADTFMPPGTELFSEFFGDLFIALWHERRFPVPSISDLEEPFLDMLRIGAGTGHEHLSIDELGDLGPGMLWLFELCWARLFGIVAIEVFGHIAPELITSGTVYTAIMRENGRSLGIEEEWPRLLEVARAESER